MPLVKKAPYYIKYDWNTIFEWEEVECISYKEKHLINEFFLKEEVNRWEIIKR